MYVACDYRYDVAAVPAAGYEIGNKDSGILPILV